MASSQTPLSVWEKLIRPSKTDFKEFRLESDWPRYKDKFETSMAASRMGHTIKKGHKVTNPEVDRAQMDWTYALLQEKMQQSTAKAIVLRHKNTRDTRVSLVFL